MFELDLLKSNKENFALFGSDLSNGIFIFMAIFVVIGLIWYLIDRFRF